MEKILIGSDRKQGAVPSRLLKCFVVGIFLGGRTGLVVFSFSLRLSELAAIGHVGLLCVVLNVESATDGRSPGRGLVACAWPLRPMSATFCRRMKRLGGCASFGRQRTGDSGWRFSALLGSWHSITVYSFYTTSTCLSGVNSRETMEAEVDSQSTRNLIVSQEDRWLGAMTLIPSYILAVASASCPVLTEARRSQRRTSCTTWGPSV